MSPYASNYGIVGYSQYCFYGYGSMLISGSYQSSDGRLKENVAPLSSALDTLRKLDPVSFTWKPNTDAANNGFTRDAGLIGQQVLRVLPEIVTEVTPPSHPLRPDGTKPAPTLNQELGSYYAIDYTRLIPWLIAAIKELDGRLQTLAGGHANG